MRTSAPPGRASHPPSHSEVAACTGPPQQTKSWGPQGQANGEGQQGGPQPHAQPHAHPMPISLPPVSLSPPTEHQAWPSTCKPTLGTRRVPSLETTASWPTASGEQKDLADGKTRAGAETGAVSSPHGEVTQVRADAMRHLGREVQQGGHTASEGLPDLM